MVSGPGGGVPAKIASFLTVFSKKRGEEKKKKKKKGRRREEEEEEEEGKKKGSTEPHNYFHASRGENGYVL